MNEIRQDPSRGLGGWTGEDEVNKIRQDPSRGLGGWMGEDEVNEIRTLSAKSNGARSAQQKRIARMFVNITDEYPNDT